MKYEWKKEEKEFYIPKEKPSCIMVPKWKYFTITGKGNPNGEAFSDKISVLYSLSYAVRMMPKTGFTPLGYFEYTVYPLEGIWDMSERGKQLDTPDKEELIYKIMIKQPNFVTKDIFERALKTVQKKKPHPLLTDVKLEEIEDGPSIQLMHKGSYDTEPYSFEKMTQALKEKGYERKGSVHREIYLNDARKTRVDKQKTVLRYFITK